MKINRQYYQKKIKKAIYFKDKNEKKSNIFSPKLEFFDNTDWDHAKKSKQDITYSDILFKCGRKTFFAFTAYAAYSYCDMFTLGCCPEIYTERGDYCLFKHSSFLTQDDISNMCMKWFLFMCPIKDLCLGANIEYNNKMIGFGFGYEAYPKTLKTINKGFRVCPLTSIDAINAI